MFRIVCDPSSGSTELCLTEITRGSQIFSVKQSSVLPDDGSHTIRNMLEWFLIVF